MEKLIELLKDQYGEVVTYNIQSDGGYMFHICGFAVREERLLSKKFGFIKWLYENNKIDRTDVPTGFEYEYQGRKDLYCVTYEVNILTMRLSIQDEPIEFLLSILK